MAGGRFRFAIDRGGTFTDVYSECPNGEVKVMKLLSVDPAYPDAPKEGIRRILQEVLVAYININHSLRRRANARNVSFILITVANLHFQLS